MLFITACKKSWYIPVRLIWKKSNLHINNFTHAVFKKSSQLFFMQSSSINLKLQWSYFPLMIAKDKVMMVMIIFIWLFRLFALKLDFENGRDTGTGTGLFCKRTSRVIDTEIWFENYQDTVTDEMPDSAFYRLLSCQTKKTVYLTYEEKPKKLGSISPLPSPFFENVEEELQDSNYFKGNKRTFPKLLKYDFLFRHKLFVL